MAYTPNNLTLLTEPYGSLPPRYFGYVLPDGDAAADITTAGYFSDAQAKGMRVGDMVEVFDTTTPAWAQYQCTAIADDGSATVAAPTALS